jgi:hypothetical protein
MKFEHSKSKKTTHDQRLENDLNAFASQMDSLSFKQAKLAKNPVVNARKFPFSTVKSGYFDYIDKQLHFHPSIDISAHGDVVFGSRSAAILLAAIGTEGPWIYRIDMPYWSIRLITISAGKKPEIFFSLGHAPKVFKVGIIQFQRGRRTLVQKCRIPTIDGTEADSDFRYCFVFRVQLKSMADVARARNLMSGSPDFPQNLKAEVISTPIKHQIPEAIENLQRTIVAHKFDYIVAFQILKLAMNNKLLPWKVEALLPHIAKCNKHYGDERTAIGLRELYRTTPAMGPETSFAEFELERLSDNLTRLIYGARREHGPYDAARKNDQLQVVHKVRITPMGLYLEGPEAEVSNRVLRTHKKNDVAFLRTQFSEEDGMRLEGSLITNLDEIYKRFRQVLQSGFKFFGHQYSFLGFSSSSLRVHTCWMMRPFTSADGGTVYGSEQVIRQIGDFTSFRSPAKCAARIGQAFTETSGFVHTSTIASIPDVERNGRIFSDGCGTISQSLCTEISLKHDHLAIPAVVFQIRFQGKHAFLT